jgi:molybdate transport system substrate-binding protein
VDDDVSSWQYAFKEMLHMTNQTPMANMSARIIAMATLLLLVATHALAAPATELLVWSAGAAQAPMTELVKDYQNDSGTTVKVEFAPVGTLLKRLSDGGKPDILILSQDVSGEAQSHGWTAPNSSAPIASVGVGIAIRLGAVEPDISSADALRTTLINAKSITYIDPAKGTSGKHFASVLEQLGIAQQVKSKTTLGEAGFVVEPVARGEVELGIQQITEILPVKGVKLVGPLPAPLQKTTIYTIAVASSARDVQLAEDFKQYILRESSLAVFKGKGFSVP